MSNSQSSHEKQLQNRHIWQDRIKRWQESNTTPTIYCRNHQLKLDQFKYWQYQFAPETIKSKTLQKPLFSQVQITQSKIVDTPLEKPNASFQLTIRDIQLQIPPQFDTKALQQLLDCLGVK